MGFRGGHDSSPRDHVGDASGELIQVAQADYVAFYFTPHSPMMYNIKTGYNQVTKRPNDQIAIVVSSLHRLKEVGTRFVFTNGHAYLHETDYFEELSDLGRVDWELLRRKDFARDPDDPGKVGRYQAEALA